VPVVFCDSESFCMWHGHLNCYQVNTQTSAYGMLGYLPVHFRYQHLAGWGVEGSILSSHDHFSHSFSSLKS